MFWEWVRGKEEMIKHREAPLVNMVIGLHGLDWKRNAQESSHPILCLCGWVYVDGRRRLELSMIQHVLCLHGY